MGKSNSDSPSFLTTNLHLVAVALAFISGAIFWSVYQQHVAASAYRAYEADRHGPWGGIPVQETRLLDPEYVASLTKTEIEDLLAEMKALLGGVQFEQHALELQGQRLRNKARDPTLSSAQRENLMERAEFFVQKAELKQQEINLLQKEIGRLNKRSEALYADL